MAVQLSKAEEVRYAEDRERAEVGLREGAAGGSGGGEGGEEAAMEEAAHVWLVRLAEIGDTRGVTELVEAGVDPDVPDSVRTQRWESRSGRSVPDAQLPRSLASMRCWEPPNSGGWAHCGSFWGAAAI